ncbi:hypothetical protein EVAR_35739_1 [Eumeta japonica]|uniref:Uncharacterized protein n=1 Tax=Eumeta variegata TaxID=151549 RepID=A0A4C1VHT1_EUMVA|nr:hypothetical protein EVAR_35739_1 [Eumeta japonica]
MRCRNRQAAPHAAVVTRPRLRTHLSAESSEFLEISVSFKEARLRIDPRRGGAGPGRAGPGQRGEVPIDSRAMPSSAGPRARGGSHLRRSAPTQVYRHYVYELRAPATAPIFFKS